MAAALLRRTKGVAAGVGGRPPELAEGFCLGNTGRHTAPSAQGGQEAFRRDFVRATDHEDAVGPFADTQGCNRMLGLDSGRLSVWAHGTQIPSFL